MNSNNKGRRFLCGSLAALLLASTAKAASTGHYYPGIMNIRDVVLPPKGFYALMYNPNINSSSYKDSNGNEVNSASVSGSGTRVVEIRNRNLDVTLNGTLALNNIEASADVTAYQGVFAWVTDQKILGADYGLFVAPSFGTTRIHASATVTGTGTLTVGRASVPVAGTVQKSVDGYKSGAGDLYVQPLWLGWHLTHFDFNAGYGFFAPVGRYDSADIANVGLGYWTNQFQGSGVFYPFTNKATALMAQATYGIQSKQDGFDLTPGQTIDFEYGLSQYLSKRLEVGLSGYNHRQVTSDSGSDAAPGGTKVEFNGAGGQLSYWMVPEKGYLSLRWLQEFSGKNHFDASVVSLNLAWVL